MFTRAIYYLLIDKSWCYQGTLSCLEYSLTSAPGMLLIDHFLL